MIYKTFQLDNYQTSRATLYAQNKFILLILSRKENESSILYLAKLTYK